MSELQGIIEALLMAAAKPLSLNELIGAFPDGEQPDKKALRQVLSKIDEDYQSRGVRLKELASGFCFQVPPLYAPWIMRLWQEKPPRLSRALLETLANIAYRQPVTRGDIEAIRGISVSTVMIKNLLDYEWIKTAGHRETVGRPTLYATTQTFLDHFNLTSLDGLPVLKEVNGEAHDSQPMTDVAVRIPIDESAECPEAMEDSDIVASSMVEETEIE